MGQTSERVWWGGRRIEHAKRLQEAFGPCTVTYEAMTQPEILDSWAAEGCTAREWAEIQLQTEEVDALRACRSDRDREDVYRFITQMKERVLKVARALDRERRGW